jgi:hypothetical protein
MAIFVSAFFLHFLNPRRLFFYKYCAGILEILDDLGLKIVYSIYDGTTYTREVMARTRSGLPAEPQWRDRRGATEEAQSSENREWG